MKMLVVNEAGRANMQEQGFQKQGFQEQGFQEPTYLICVSAITPTIALRTTRSSPEDHPWRLVRSANVHHTSRSQS